jgi:hypothetical protein
MENYSALSQPSTLSHKQIASGLFVLNSLQTAQPLRFSVSLLLLSLSISSLVEIGHLHLIPVDLGLSSRQAMNAIASSAFRSNIHVLNIACRV